MATKTVAFELKFAKKSQGQPRYQDGHQSISASFLFTHLDAYRRQSTERLWRLQTVELLRELVGLKEATSGRDSILPTPETNSKFTPENGWLEYSFPFWDGANCYFQGM